MFKLFTLQPLLEMYHQEMEKCKEPHLDATVDQSSQSDSSSVETLNTEGMTVAKTVKNTEDSAISTSANVVGIKVQDNNVCNLSVFCNDSVFYMGTKKFQTSENSSDTSYNLTVQYPGDTFNKFQLTVPQSLPQRPNNSSGFNSTMSYCGGHIGQAVNIVSNGACDAGLLMNGNQTEFLTKIVEIFYFSISAFNQTLQKLSESSAMKCSAENQSVSDCTFIIKLEKERNISHILQDLKDVAEIGLIASYPPIRITVVSQPTSLTKPTAVVSPAMPTTSSAMNTTSGVHSTSDENGNPEFPHLPNASGIEKIVSELERNLSAEEISPSLARQMVNKVSELLDVPQSQISPMSKRIIKIVDAIGLKLNFSTESIDLTSPSLALAVLKVNSSHFSTVSFSVKNTSDLQVTLGNQISANGAGTITLPSSILTNLPSEAMHQASRITFNFFEKTTLFQDPSLKNLSLISHVISSSVANVTVNNLKTNVTVTLQNARPTQENLTVRCAFWNFTNNGGKGGWAYEGCVVKERRTNETVCSCNHLTSFGVLLDLSRNTTVSPTQVLILTFITYIGCGLSAIFLSVTLVTYIAFEKIRRDYPSKILIQLCIALLLLNLVFLLDSWIALSNIRGLCISVAVFLHYFLLVSFTWMGLEAFHMYLALVKVFNTYVRKYILKFCVVGWGMYILFAFTWVPAIVVAIVLAINPDNYGLGSYGNFPNGSPDEFCWINNNIVFYITVVGYFCTIFLLNVSMFIVVLIQLCRIKKKKQLGAQRKTSIQDLRSVAGLTFLLGITWGFAFFAWGPINLVFMYLFAIFNTLQGFFIFIFYCVAKENVRKQWRRYLCCGKYRLAENSDWSRTATNGLKKQNVNQGVSSSSNSLQSNSNSTNSTSMLMNNDYSVHANGNGNISSEKNGVSFNVHNGDVRLHDFSGKQIIFHENNDTGHKKPRISLRRTSERGNLHFIEPM
ncbi:hypothetical protein lerEdw1_016720 [Lerista edwardsae]|nr:hypothetical protein lerEdw1_016720 [Lerista edwardsae]